MPTINYEQSDHRVPLADSANYSRRPLVDFVKLQNVRSDPYGSRNSRIFTVVHIENTLDRPYGGQSLTYCGRLLEVGHYMFVLRWYGDYTTCKVCHARAMKRRPDYREEVEVRADKQLTLQEG